MKRLLFLFFVFNSLILLSQKPIQLDPQGEGFSFLDCTHNQKIPLVFGSLENDLVDFTIVRDSMLLVHLPMSNDIKLYDKHFIQIDQYNYAQSIKQLKQRKIYEGDLLTRTYFSGINKSIVPINDSSVFINTLNRRRDMVFLQVQIVSNQIKPIVTSSDELNMSTIDIGHSIYSGFWSDTIFWIQKRASLFQGINGVQEEQVLLAYSPISNDTLLHLKNFAPLSLFRNPFYIFTTPEYYIVVNYGLKKIYWYNKSLAKIMESDFPYLSMKKAMYSFLQDAKSKYIYVIHKQKTTKVNSYSLFTILKIHDFDFDTINQFYIKGNTTIKAVRDNMGLLPVYNVVDKQFYIHSMDFNKVKIYDTIVINDSDGAKSNVSLVENPQEKQPKRKTLVNNQLSGSDYMLVPKRIIKKFNQANIPNRDEFPQNTPLELLQSLSEASQNNKWEYITAYLFAYTKEEYKEYFNFVEIGLENKCVWGKDANVTEVLRDIANNPKITKYSKEVYLGIYANWLKYRIIKKGDYFYVSTPANAY